MTERVLLCDIDSKIPNLALMKISSYYKQKGSEVGYNIADPTKIYASCIFKKNKHLTDGLQYLYPDAEIDIGGSGYDLNKTLPDDIECCIPDYSLYPEWKRYLGFTTRGCIRACSFCIVHKKEGEFRRIYDTPMDAFKSMGCPDMQFKEIQLLDNNILADRSWFFELTDHFPLNYLKWDFNQGLDIRLLNEEVALRLSELKPITCWRFAFDNMSYKNDVLRGIEILRQTGMDLKHKCTFYVYCDNEEQIPDAVERCNILKEHRCNAYTMINLDVSSTPKLRALKRWSRPTVFWACTYEQFYNSYKRK